jgi:hypothetical protein
MVRKSYLGEVVSHSTVDSWEFDAEGRVKPRTFYEPNSKGAAPKFACPTILCRPPAAEARPCALVY